MMSTQINRFFDTGEPPIFLDYIPYHNSLLVPYNYQPSEFEHQIIISSMAGDGSLMRPYKAASPSARISWNMGNKEHALYKAKCFEFIGSSYSEKTNPGFGENWYCVKTKSHPLLTRYGEKYGFTKKRLNPRSGIYHELNEIGWAWLYGDDGHFCKESGIAYIHTESFSFDHVSIIKDALNTFMGSDACEIHAYNGGAKKRRMYCLRMKKNATKEFIKRIGEHMANGVEYKRGYY